MAAAPKARGWSIVALALLTLAVVTGSAVAGNRLKTKSATEAVGVDDNGSSHARCKRGTNAVSGGFETEFDSEPIFTSPIIRVNESRGTGRRGWTTSGFNSGYADGDLTTFVYCRDQKPTQVTNTVAAPVGEFVTATAKCPAGTKVISGGFEGSPIDPVGPTPVLYFSESRRATKRTWEASAYTTGTESGELTAIAYCDDAKKPKARDASVTLNDATRSADVIARCKRRERAISGGFGSPDFSNQDTAKVFASRRAGKRGWSVNSFYGDFGAPVEVTAYAYCERK
jgi:hypothetical protein